MIMKSNLNIYHCFYKYLKNTRREKVKKVDHKGIYTIKCTNCDYLNLGKTD